MNKLITKFRIWLVTRKRYLNVRDLVFLVRCGELGYDVPRIAGIDVPARDEQEST